MKYNDNIIFNLIEIGQSTVDELPFWAVKLTYDANEENDKPKVLILGQCHAEEILGVEISMAIIDIFLNPASPRAYRPSISISNLKSILEKSEVWVVPTHNPEGLNVVHGWESDGVWYQDESYRKNKRDVNENGFFDYIVGVGNDSDGVDLNRNYDLNWFFGDEAYEADLGGCNVAYYSDFDYYKGTIPFSESEVRAIRDLAISKNFLLSIAYHSSRSGCVSEKVIYSWAWGDSTKFSPDVDVIHSFGENIASFIEKDGGSGIVYDATISKSRKGNAHDWLYANAGCIQYLIEVGTSDIQPDDDVLIDDIVEKNLQGAYHLMNRAASYKNGTFGADIHQVIGLVTDLETGEPVQAEVRIMEMDAGVLQPRYTDTYGRYRRLLDEGSYTVIIQAIGYESDTTIVTSSSSILKENDVQLVPIEKDSLYIDLSLYGTYIPSAQLIIPHHNEIVDTLILNAGLNYFLYPHGKYNVQLMGDGKLTEFFEIDLDSIQSLQLHLYDSRSEFIEPFDNLNGWEILSGDWVENNGSLISQSNILYSNNLEQSIRYTSEISLNVNSIYALRLEMGFELEWDNDTLIIQIFNDDNLLSSKKWTDQQWTVHTEYLPIPEETPQINNITISLITDNSVEYRGLQIDEIAIDTGTGQLLNISTNSPYPFQLRPNYPNPFNPTTIISFFLEKPGLVDVSVFNLKGEKIKNLIENEWKPAGLNNVSFNADGLGSGIYFYTLNFKNFSKTQKMVIIK